MKNSNHDGVVVTGLGVTSAVGQGVAQFSSALLQGRHNFSVMRRPGRQATSSSAKQANGEQPSTAFLGAEIPGLSIPETIPETVLRTASFSAQTALVTLEEAWRDARLDQADPFRIGLVVGGSNVQQREQQQTRETYRDRIQFMRPTYGMSFMDSDICGLCTEVFGIRDFAYTLGGASASGQVAVIQAIHAVQSGQADICIAMGALMDLSCWECQGLRSLGAMGSDRFANEPELACRPFDRDRDGFIFGECCGVVVVERELTVNRKGVNPYARFTGWSICMDGNRNPNPSVEGEIKVIGDALNRANLLPKEVDYINPHGTGSVIGDETELETIHRCRLDHAYLNATKSVIGHGLSAAGTVEIIATLLQMKEGKLHPTRNLEDPMDSSCNWVRDKAVEHNIECALNLSMGFGGVNTALCMQRC